MVFDDKIEKKVCGICKLAFEANQRKISCSNCNSLFHEKHLIIWLSKNPTCPICMKDFSEEIKKYSLNVPTPISDDDFIIDANPQLIYNNAFSRPKNVEEQTKPAKFFDRVSFFIVGILFGFPLTLVTSLCSPFPEAWLTLIYIVVELPLYFIGILALEATFEKYKEKPIIDFWDEINFTKDGIIVSKLDFSTKEILGKDIRILRLIKVDYTDKSSKDSKTNYYINLKLTTFEDEKIAFGKIFFTNDSLERDYIYNSLAYQIRNVYQINPLPVYGEKTLEDLTNNWKHCGIIILSFVILKIILLLINYFFIST